MSDHTDLLDRARALTKPAAASDPGLLDDLLAADDLSTWVEAGRLLGRVRPDLVVSRHPEIRLLRVAITATFTVQSVEPLLRLALLSQGIVVDPHVSGFNQLMLELSDPGSALADFRPEVVLCLLDERFLMPAGWDPLDPGQSQTAAYARIDALEDALAGFLDRVPATALINTVPLNRDTYKTVVSYQGKAALGRAWRALNTALLGIAERQDRAYILDLETLLASHPGVLSDPRLVKFATMSWAPGVERLYAFEAASFCRAVAGMAKKCLVLDLDNTLWGGVIGDDGPAGVQCGPLYPGNCYLDLQQRVKALRRQGVLLAIASKNDEATVRDAFGSIPGLALAEDDFAASWVSWEPKDRGIAALADELNLGLGSFVFADDSAFETELVRSALPHVTVVRLDGDPAGYASTLLSPGSFDVLEVTATDARRTDLYRMRARRARAARSFSSATEYLGSLGLRVRVAPADEFSLPRIVQLGQRTNQFTMIKPPHSEEATRRMARSATHLLLGFEAADRFGSEGLVGAVWIERGPAEWTIENFVMSCRVFSRGIENAVLHHVADLAGRHGAATLAGVFRHSGRNAPAAGFYQAAGFRELRGDDETLRYRLDLGTPVELCPEWITLEAE